MCAAFTFGNHYDVVYPEETMDALKFCQGRHAQPHMRKEVSITCFFVDIVYRAVDVAVEEEPRPHHYQNIAMKLFLSDKTGWSALRCLSPLPLLPSSPSPPKLSYLLVPEQPQQEARIPKTPRIGEG